MKGTAVLNIANSKDPSSVDKAANALHTDNTSDPDVLLKHHVVNSF